MSSIYPRKSGQLYARLKGLKAPGKWCGEPTPFSVGEEAQAEAWSKKMQAKIDRKLAGGAVHGGTTLQLFYDAWIIQRRALDLDAAADASRLKNHVLPVLGDRLLTEILTPDIVALFAAIRSYKGARVVGPRTIYNIYSSTGALFRDAQLAGKIAASPCVLDERQLGPKRDKDPEWRSTAVFDRDEAVTLISAPVIPADRRVVYALELLAGVRCGEAAALRWRHYDATIAPLGRLVVARSYNTRKNREKATKTDVTKHVPVHPTLAAILAGWREHGWRAVYGRDPSPDDLIVPLPPEAVSRRRSREGEAFRGFDYSGKRWREKDLPALGWRHRRHYDMRATFITLAIQDGADAEVIEMDVTHTRQIKSAIDGYKRQQRWGAACREVAKLRIELATGLLHEPASSSGDKGNWVEAVGVESGPVSVSVLQSAATQRKDSTAMGRRAPYRPRSVASLATALAEAVLAGDDITSRRLALEIRERGESKRAAATQRMA